MQCNGMWQERFPVFVPSTVELCKTLQETVQNIYNYSSEENILSQAVAFLMNLSLDFQKGSQ